MIIYNFHNEYHLGDCIFHLNYLRSITRKYPNRYLFNFYIKPEYFTELSFQLIGYTNIFLRDIQYKPDDSIDCWIGPLFYQNTDKEIIYYDELYIEYYKNFSSVYNLPCVYNDINDFLFNHEFIKIKYIDISYDILFINSIPLSGQYEYDEEAMLDYISKYNPEHVITTKKINGFRCTTDSNMNLLDIGILSKNAKIIVGVNTSPIIACLNKYTLKNIERFIVLDLKNTYSHPKIEYYKNIKEVD